MESQATKAAEPCKQDRWSTSVRLSGGASPLVAVVWIITILYNIATWSIAFVFEVSLFAHGSLLWLVPGVGLLAVAIYVTLRKSCSGRWSLDLETRSGCIGGWLAGTIHTTPPLGGDAEVQLTLTCVRQHVVEADVFGSRQQIVWRDKQVLAGSFPREGDDTAVPVAFQLSPTCPASRSDGRDTVKWQLTAKVLLAGSSRSADFVIPVCQTAAPTSLPPAAELVACKLRRPAPSPVSRAAAAGFALIPQTAGQFRFEFPAARNLGLAAMFGFCVIMPVGMGTLFIKWALLWSGLAWYGFAAIFSIPVLLLLCKSSTIDVREDEVETRWHMLGLSGGRVLPKRSIAAVRYRTTMQMQNTPYLQIRLICVEGKAVAVAGGLSMEDAKWVAQHIAQAIGVEATFQA